MPSARHCVLAMRVCRRARGRGGPYSTTRLSTTTDRPCTVTSSWCSKRCSRSTPSPVWISTSQQPPKRRTGRWKARSSWWALTSTRKESSVIAPPRRFLYGISWPLRNRPSCGTPERQSLLVILLPSGRNHQASGRPEPPCSSPDRKAERWKTGCSRRRRISRRVKASSSCCSEDRFQSYQEISESWHQALLLPPCERPNSSPPSSIGVPDDSTSVVRKLRIWRSRSATTAGSSVGPSTPQFQDRLSSVPSRLSSMLASLCLSL